MSGDPNPFFSIWGNQRQPMDGLEVLREVAIAAEAGRPIQEPAATQIRKAVHSYINGAALDKALGLRARKGRPYEQPRRRAAHNQRNGLIRELIAARGGTATAASKWLIAALDSKAAVPESLAPKLMELKSIKGIDPPSSVRQCMRIVKKPVK